MPRRFTPEEEQVIRESLRQAARAQMGPRGVRRTSIDELVRAAGISKGSFYRFWESKESLALDLLAEWEREFHRTVEQRFQSEQPRGFEESAAFLRSVLVEEFPRRMITAGMQGLLNPDEIAHLARAAGEREARIMDEQDLRFFDRLRPLFLKAGLRPTEDTPVIVAGLRAVFEAGASVVRPSGVGGGSAASGDSDDTEAPAPELTSPADGVVASGTPAGDVPADRESVDGAASPRSPSIGPGHPDRGPALAPEHFHRALALMIEGFLRQTFSEEVA